ncbi:Ig-like domain-containing protein [Bacillus sp. JCM 19034]|uniref:Ig-like domain-containing protein n=1 Tax=Bacillus sp. JCM 19034 TaxID=1481928 RepID=UPI000782E5D8|nr:Ig-like domain-containing protein [Bacillus sp. JCM 19034]
MYQFTGTLKQLDEIGNPEYKQATVEVIVEPPVIVEVVDLGDIAVKRVANGTKRSELELPEKVEVVLNNGEVTEIAVTWDDGNPPYDERKAGTYTFTGTFALSQNMFSTLVSSIASTFTSEGNYFGEIQNPDHVTVTIDVEVDNPFITEVEQLDNIQVVNGIKREDLDLPEYVEVMLNNGDKANIYVNWDEGVPIYNEKVAGAYHFTGMLEQLGEIENIHDKHATIKVLVGDPIITTVERLEKVTVVNGTKRTELELPEQVEITLNNGEVVKVDVTWNEGDPQYDGMQAGTYPFIGTLEWSSELQIVNPNNLQATVEVEVDQPVIAEIEALAPIQVENGTKRSELELPEMIEVLLNNGEKAMLM